MRRFELEDVARARMAEFGAGTPWQAYVQIRLRIYEEMLGDPKLIQEHRYPHNIALLRSVRQEGLDRKSTRLNSSHANISYAVFCLKKKKNLIRYYFKDCSNS